MSFMVHEHGKGRQRRKRERHLYSSKPYNTAATDSEHPSSTIRCNIRGYHFPEKVSHIGACRRSPSRQIKVSWDRAVGFHYDRRINSPLAYVPYEFSRQVKWRMKAGADMTLGIPLPRRTLVPCPLSPVSACQTFWCQKMTTKA
jgi:hypothetical protein